MKRNRTQKPLKNPRERHYNRVLMAKEAEQYKKAGAIIGLLFVLLLIIGLVASLAGCAAKKPTKAQHPTAQLVIPRECASGFEWTKKTTCKTVQGNGSQALCGPVLVKVMCVQSVVK